MVQIKPKVSAWCRKGEKLCFSNLSKLTLKKDVYPAFVYYVYNKHPQTSYIQFNWIKFLETADDMQKLSFENGKHIN